ncbi:hypothetical protein ScPMuIL_002542, partial [Solemya velum]
KMKTCVQIALSQPELKVYHLVSPGVSMYTLLDIIKYRIDFTGSDTSTCVFTKSPISLTVLSTPTSSRPSSAAPVVLSAASFPANPIDKTQKGRRSITEQYR